MQNMLVVNSEGPETRVAVVEEGSLAEFFVERKRDRGMVGNIYRGKVTRVLPGMQAAFVDLGPKVERAAFLYVADVLNWRFQVFESVSVSGKAATYIPTKRWFWDRQPSTGWSTRTTTPKN